MRLPHLLAYLPQIIMDPPRPPPTEQPLPTDTADESEGSDMGHDMEDEALLYQEEDELSETLLATLLVNFVVGAVVV